MADYLVSLYDLPPVPGLPEGLVLHRPLPHESPMVLEYVEREFSRQWAAESGPAFSRVPPSIHVAVETGPEDQEKTMLIRGFCCYDCTFRGFLGPVGVSASARGQGIGAALVLQTLHVMRHVGYAYCVVGAVGAGDFFTGVCRAVEIPGSDPGPYSSPLR